MYNCVDLHFSFSYTKIGSGYHCTFDWRVSVVGAVSHKGNMSFMIGCCCFIHNFRFLEWLFWYFLRSSFLLTFILNSIVAVKITGRQSALQIMFIEFMPLWVIQPGRWYVLSHCATAVWSCRSHSVVHPTAGSNPLFLCPPQDDSGPPSPLEGGSGL